MNSKQQKKKLEEEKLDFYCSCLWAVSFYQQSTGLYTVLLVIAYISRGEICGTSKVDSQSGTGPSCCGMVDCVAFDNQRSSRVQGGPLQKIGRQANPARNSVSEIQSPIED